MGYHLLKMEDKIWFGIFLPSMGMILLGIGRRAWVSFEWLAMCFLGKKDEVSHIIELASQGALSHKSIGEKAFTTVV
jgi:hypothetical protein